MAFSAWCWASRWWRSCARQRLPFAIEVIGFSEEEGVRFSKPFLGSLALIGKLDEGYSRADGCARRERGTGDSRFRPRSCRNARRGARCRRPSLISNSISSRGRCSKAKICTRSGRGHRRTDPPAAEASRRRRTTPARRRCICATMRWRPQRSGSSRWKSWPRSTRPGRHSRQIETQARCGKCDCRGGRQRRSIFVTRTMPYRLRCAR